MNGGLGGIHEIPSSTTINLGAVDTTGFLSVGETMSWVASGSANLASAVGATLYDTASAIGSTALEVGTAVKDTAVVIGTAVKDSAVETAVDLGTSAAEIGSTVARASSEIASTVGTAAAEIGGTAATFALAHPIAATAITGVAVTGTFFGTGYIQGWMSSSSVSAPASNAESIAANAIAPNLQSKSGQQLTSLQNLFANPQTINPADQHRVDTVAVNLGGGQAARVQHVEQNLAAFALRGAHIAKNDNGLLFQQLYQDVTGQALPAPGGGGGHAALNTLNAVNTAHFPNDMVERNSKWWNGSSHYKPTDPGHFAGLRQFGVDVGNGQGHLLFGLRDDGNGGVQSWFQFEGHGLSSWKDFSMHGRDLFVHLGSGKGQVGPGGVCAFTEKNNREIVLQ